VFPNSFRRSLAVGTAAVIALFGLGPTSTAAAAVPASATKAADYLSAHLPRTKDGFEKSFQTTLGLAATGSCTYSVALTTLRSNLESLTPAYVKSGGATAAAKAAIAVASIGSDPSAFAGKDLVAAITKDLPASGKVVGSNGFSQALAVIALERADADLPASMVTNLLGYQGADGGFAWSTTADADPDTTAVAILALQAVGGHSAEVTDATDWAADSQGADGSWAATFQGTELSPVDSTGLLGSALAATGADVTTATSWLTGQQLDSGAFANVRDGDTADLMSTTDAVYLLTGSPLSTALVDLNACPFQLPASTSSCTGVWVVVFREADDYSVRCAAQYATGFDALKSAGFTAGIENDFLNRINGYPEVIDTTWSKFWNYYHAAPNADGTWGTWTSYDVGGAESQPVKGSVEAWVYSAWGEDPTVQPPRGYASTVTPKVSGTRKVGRTLTAIRGSWDPAPDTYSFRWYRNGSAISGATSKSYKLKKADKGKRISVKVTGRGAGLQTVSIYSARTGKIK